MGNFIGKYLDKKRDYNNSQTSLLYNTQLAQLTHLEQQAQLFRLARIREFDAEIEAAEEAKEEAKRSFNLKANIVLTNLFSALRGADLALFGIIEGYSEAY